MYIIQYIQSIKKAYLEENFTNFIPLQLLIVWMGNANKTSKEDKICATKVHLQADWPDPHSGMPEAALAVVVAGVGGVTLGILHLQLRQLGVHTVLLWHAVLPQVLQEVKF